VVADANQVYEDSIVNLKTRKPVEKRTRRNFAEKDQAAKDYYASVRTNVSQSGRDARQSHN
jgi:chitin synthase